VDTMREWFRTYKVSEGKPLNAFALDEKCMGRDYAEAGASTRPLFCST